MTPAQAKPTWTIRCVGLLNLNVTPKFGMAVGWRYLDVDYHTHHERFRL